MDSEWAISILKSSLRCVWSWLREFLTFTGRRKILIVLSSMDLIFGSFLNAASMLTHFIGSSQFTFCCTAGLTWTMEGWNPVVTSELQLCFLSELLHLWYCSALVHPFALHFILEMWIAAHYHCKPKEFWNKCSW